MDRIEYWKERFSIMVEGETDRGKVKASGLLAGQETAILWWEYVDRCQGFSLNKIRRLERRQYLYDEIQSS